MSGCNIIDNNQLNSSGSCSTTVVSNGNPAAPQDNGKSCLTTPTGKICPRVETCSPWDLSNSPDACYIDKLIQESLAIGGAPVNVYKLLGVHEQGTLVDLVGDGNAFASSFIPNYPPENAFDKYISEWRSVETGGDVTNKAFIGYDFGELKLKNGRDRYGLETYVKKDISTIKLKQGCDSNTRITKMRIERSNDGVKWFGVAIINVEDCDGLVTYSFNKSVPSRWWRFRPIAFNGTNDDYWSVQALQLMDYEETAVNNIQDRIFLENRDRDYDTLPKTLKGQYQPIDLQSFMSHPGMTQMGEQYSIEFSFSSVVNLLGRPFVIGDILQLPSETQFTYDLKPVYKYLEVIDVTWSTNGYTPSWQPLIQKIIAIPATASQETQDIFGKMSRTVDATGVFDINNGEHPTRQDYSDITQTISADANTQTPVKGEDASIVTKFSDELIQFSDDHPNMNLRKFDRTRSAWGVDAIPPNGLPYTEGDAFPTTPSNGAYHRLTYTNIGKGIPARLYRFSSVKGTWIYLETDTRDKINDKRPFMQEFLSPDTSTVTPIDKIGQTMYDS